MCSVYKTSEKFLVKFPTKRVTVFMGIFFSQLCQDLNFKCAKSGDVNNEINNVLPYSKDLTPQDNSTVVVGTFYDLSQAGYGRFHNFLCTTQLSDVSDPKWRNIYSIFLTSISSVNMSTYFQDPYPDCQIAYAQNTTTVTETVEQARKELLWQVQFFEKAYNLYKTLSDKQGLQHIIDVATIVLNNAIVVADNSFQVLAFSHDVNLSDHVWQYIVKNHCYPADYIEYLVAKKNYSIVYKAPSTQLLMDDKQMRPYFSRKLTVDGKDVAFISLIGCNHSLDWHDEKLLDVLRKILTIELKNSKVFHDSYNQKYMYVLNELLTEDMTDTKLNERLSYAHLKPLKYLNVMLVLCNGIQNVPLEYILRKIKEQIPCTHGVIRSDDSVVFLAMRNSSKHNLISDNGNFQKLLIEYNLVLGISYTYCKISNTKIYFQQAVKAIQIGQRLDPKLHIFDYMRYSYYHMFELLSQQTQLQRFCNPKLLEIMDYDALYKTNYLHTFQVYIDCDMNVAQTASVLKVHRNTIDYRLNKLKDLFEVDLTDSAVHFSYQISFYILRYLNPETK